MSEVLPVVNEIHADAPSDGVTVILSLEQLIKSHVQSIEKLKEEKKKIKETIDDSLLGDVVYQEKFKVAKEATKQKNATKLQILKQPSNIILANKLKGITSELKDKRLALSDYLLDYQRQTKATQLELFDGSIGEIVQVAKIVKAA